MTVNEIEAFYNTHRQKMYNAAYDILRNDHDAEDAVQNSIEKMLRSCHRLNFSCSKAAAAYAVRVARNAAIDMTRCRKNTASLDTVNELPCFGSPSAQLEAEATKATVDSALANIGGNAAAILTMKQQGVTDKVIAETLNISVSNVRVTAFRARLKIKEHLSEEGLFYE